MKVGNAWHLRGITSTSFVLDDGRCDTSNFAVFTDVYHFYDWIYEIIGPALHYDGFK